MLATSSTYLYVVTYLMDVDNFQVLCANTYKVLRSVSLMAYR